MNINKIEAMSLDFYGLGGAKDCFAKIYAGGNQVAFYNDSFGKMISAIFNEKDINISGPTNIELRFMGRLASTNNVHPYLLKAVASDTKSELITWDNKNDQLLFRAHNICPISIIASITEAINERFESNEIILSGVKTINNIKEIKTELNILFPKSTFNNLYELL